MRIRRFLTNPRVLTVVMLMGLFVAWASAGQLRYGYPFSMFFEQTCIYIPDEQVLPILGVFIVALGSAISCAGILIRNHVAARRWMFRIVVSLLAFGIGELVSNRF